MCIDMLKHFNNHEDLARTYLIVFVLLKLKQQLKIIIIWDILKLNSICYILITFLIFLYSSAKS